MAQALSLAEGTRESVEVARKCFEFVRDEIMHSWDYGLDPVTCVASDVLKYGTGFCYAKSHLLAALLRANGIPAGLCYQRLAVSGTVEFCLHGLNAVYLDGLGWYRIDARGNNEGVSTGFSPPEEQMAYAVCQPDEANLPEIWAEPLSLVTGILMNSQSFQDVSNNLPDIELINM